MSFFALQNQAKVMKPKRWIRSIFSRFVNRSRNLAQHYQFSPIALLTKNKELKHKIMYHT